MTPTEALLSVLSAFSGLMGTLLGWALHRHTIIEMYKRQVAMEHRDIYAQLYKALRSLRMNINAFLTNPDEHSSKLVESLEKTYTFLNSLSSETALFIFPKKLSEELEKLRIKLARLRIKYDKLATMERQLIILRNDLKNMCDLIHSIVGW